jgi:hypothetical protein
VPVLSSLLDEVPGHDLPRPCAGGWPRRQRRTDQ